MSLSTLPSAVQLEASTIVVTAHSIANMPSGVQQVDPTRSQFMLVVQGLLRFVPPTGVTQHFAPLQMDESGAGSGGTNTTSSGSRELPALHVPFSPAAVLYRNEQFSVKLDTQLVDFSAPQPSPLTPPPPPLCEAPTAPRSGGVFGASRVWRVWRGTSVPPDCLSVIDVFVGVMEVRNSSGSSANRWITTPPHAINMHHERFAISAAQIGANVLTTRVVGTTFGQVTISLWAADVAGVGGAPLVSGEPREARLADFIARNPAALSLPPIVTRAAAVECSELAAISHMRRAVNPLHYAEQVRILLTPYCSDRPEVIESKLRELNEWGPGREEFFLRQLVMEFGPDVRSVNPRRRLQAFARVHKLTEADIQGATQGMNIDRAPDAFMEVLVARFGPEPAPSRYMFPLPHYDPDPRAYLLDHLSFPANKPGKNSRDVALAARQKRKAFTSSPNERETEVRVNRRQLTEIEILSEKHEPEFRQIVPSVADALQAVIDQHRPLLNVITRDDRFAKYDTDQVPRILLEDYVHRLAEYTFISPASMIGALMFIDRLCERHHTMLITERNVFKLFFVAVRVSSKVIDLRTLNNHNFAKVGGVTNKLLNEVEEAFLKHLKFDLFVGPAELHEYTKRLNPPLTMNRVPRGLPSAGGAANGGAGAVSANGAHNGHRNSLQ